jgi:putative hydrolase of the HAD superfamily
MSTDIKAVVFDFGGVLTLQPLDHHIDSLRALCGLDRPAFLSAYRRHRPEYDRGTIDSREYWSRVINSEEEVPDQGIFRSLFETDVAGWTRVNEPVLRLAERLQAAGMRTGILSNMPREILKRIENRFLWIDRFEVRIFSCEIGVNKPGAEIYEACIDAFGLEGSRVLFLDDVPDNVKGAERAGFRTVLFRSYADALNQIIENAWLPANLLLHEEIR